jgi:hypothetical protein
MNFSPKPSTTFTPSGSTRLWRWPKDRPELQSRSQRKARKKVAYHEAGHAVAAVVLGRAIIHVSIVPTGEWLGHIRHPKGIADPSFQSVVSLRERPPLEIKAKAAWLKRFQRRVRTDGARLALRRRRARAEIAIRLAGSRAEKIFSGRWDNWGARHDREHALDLADLLANDSSVTSKGILDREDARADRILKENWPSVEAVADALLGKSQLSGREVRAIVKATK